jgi:hypothetical protein
MNQHAIGTPAIPADGRYRADFPEGTVIFLIGMRINSLRRIREWWAPFMAMPKMIAELKRHPELGLLDAQSWWAGRNFLVTQYWESMDALMRYATGRDAEHFPAWQAFMKASAGAAGIWHEAYVVDPQTSHIVYRNMPAFGMGKATRFVAVNQLPPQPVMRHPVSTILGDAVAE